jgi:putative DNA-binding protein
MIKYVIRSKKNPQKKDVVKYYPQMASTTPLSLEQIIRRVEKRSTVSSADVKAVLDALQYEVIEALASGSTVRLGDLGSFRLTMKSEGSATAAEAKQKGAQLIKRVNVQFTKSTTMRDTLSVPLLDFGAQEDIVNATDKKKE